MLLFTFTYCLRVTFLLLRAVYVLHFYVYVLFKCYIFKFILLFICYIFTFTCFYVLILHLHVVYVLHFYVYVLFTCYNLRLQVVSFLTVSRIIRRN